jgi:restriction system protein
LARRRKKQDPVAALLQLVFIVAFLGTFLITKSFIAAFIVFILCLGIFIAVMVARKAAEAERLKKSGIADIDKMDGIQFEKYLGHMFQAHGYKVQVTQASGDFGADLIIQKENKRIAVQAKRYSSNVGLKAVQEAVASKAHYQAIEAWVITNSKFTEQAKQLASSNNVKLLSRNDLVEMILKMNPGSAPSAKQVIAENPTRELNCTRCGNQMVLRKGSKGAFYGCSSFPKCRNVIEA